MPLPPRPLVRYLIGLLALMVLFYGVYYYPYPPGSSVDRAMSAYQVLQARLAGAMIGVFDSTVHVTGTSILGRYSLEIIKDCSSLDAQALLAAAVLAFPTRWPLRLIGVLLGFAVLGTANIARIVGLYFVGADLPAQFDLVHEELMPLLLIVVAGGCFSGWLVWAHGERNRAAHAA